MGVNLGARHPVADGPGLTLADHVPVGLADVPAAAFVVGANFHGQLYGLAGGLVLLYRHISGGTGSKAQGDLQQLAAQDFWHFAHRIPLHALQAVMQAAPSVLSC